MEVYSCMGKSFVNHHFWGHVGLLEGRCYGSFSHPSRAMGIQKKRWEIRFREPTIRGWFKSFIYVYHLWLFWGWLTNWVYHMKVSAIELGDCDRMVINPWQKGYTHEGGVNPHAWLWNIEKLMTHHWKKWCPILQDKPKSGVCQYWKEEMMLARFWENVSFIFFLKR
jgi:hypothetical protein